MCIRLHLDSWLCQLCCLLQARAPGGGEERGAPGMAAAAPVPAAGVHGGIRAPVRLHGRPAPLPVIWESVLSAERARLCREENEEMVYIREAGGEVSY